MEEDLSRFCCQRPDCPDFGQRGLGNLIVVGRYGKNQPIRVLYCRTCKARFSEQKGPPSYRSSLRAAKAVALTAHLANRTSDNMGELTTEALLGTSSLWALRARAVIRIVLGTAVALVALVVIVSYVFFMMAVRASLANGHSFFRGAVPPDKVILIYIVSNLSFFASCYLLWFGKTLLALSGQEAWAMRTRWSTKYVLYLRWDADDGADVPTSWSPASNSTSYYLGPGPLSTVRQLQSFEEVIVRVFKKLGPVYALSRPDQVWPPPGAYRWVVIGGKACWAIDLRLMFSLNDVSGIPTEGKDLIIVAAVNNVLHFRIFEGDGKIVVDTDEQTLTKQARRIEDLKKQLESLWPPYELTRSDKDRIIAAVTSIVGHNPCWKPLVLYLLKRAYAVVLVAGKGKGVNWELQQIAKMGALPRTWLVFPPEPEPSAISKFVRDINRPFLHPSDQREPNSKPRLDFCRESLGPVGVTIPEGISDDRLILLRFSSGNEVQSYEGRRDHDHYASVLQSTIIAFQQDQRKRLS